MTDIRINQLPVEPSPSGTDVLPIDGATTRQATVTNVVLAGRPTASQAEAEAGTDPVKSMTPLTTAQAIAFQAGAGFVPISRTLTPGTGLTGGGDLSADRSFALNAISIASLADADTALQPTDIGTTVQAHSANLDELATVNPDTAGKAILAMALPADVRDYLDATVYVADRTALKALDTTKDTVAILKEASREGVFIWTAGNFSTQIAADTLEGVYVKATAIASTAGAWVRLFKGPLNVCWFGAKSDGATSCTAAFQAAHDLLPVSFGGAVYMPPSDNSYVIDAPINISTSSVTYFGDAGAASITIVDHDFDIFAVTATHSFSLRNVHVVAFGTPAGGRYIVNTSTNRGCIIDGVSCAGAMSSAFRVPHAETQVRNCVIKGLMPNQGIFVNLDTGWPALAEVCQIVSCNVYNSPGLDCFAGVYTTGGGPLEMTDVSMAKCGNNVYANVPTGQVMFSIVLNNVWCDTSDGSGMYLKTAGTGIIARVRGVNSWFSSNAEYGIRIAGNVYGLKISNSEIFANTLHGIVVEAGSVLKSLIVNGNQIAGNGVDGVNIAASITEFQILGNRIGPSADFGANAGYAINLGASTADYTIADNDVRGNTTGSVNGHTAHLTSKVVRNNRGFVTRGQGTASGTPNGSGDMVVTHGMGITPNNFSLVPFGAAFIVAQVQAVTATTFTIRLFDAAGAAITSGSRDIYWQAQ